MRILVSGGAMVRRSILFSLIALAAFVVYWPALNGGFVWDDSAWTSQLSALTADASGLLEMWTSPTALQQYYPLTGTTFWLDHQWWGTWTFPHHLENLIFHLLSALLFWHLLRRLAVPGAWLAGLIVVFHPVMVESVAWITERKNVLCQCLLLAAILSYGRFTNFWRLDAEPRRGGDWWLAFALFIAAALAKITACVMGPTILLLCWWKRGSIRRQDVLLTLPFFVVALGLGLLVTWLEKNHVGAEGIQFEMPFAERCLIAGRVPWTYLSKLIWPVGLCPIDHRWSVDVRSWWQWLFPVMTLGSLVWLWLKRESVGRGVVVAVLLFVGTLIPVLGFLNVYGMLFSFTADRWMYVSSLSVIALFSAGVVNAAQRWGSRWLPVLLAAVSLPSLGWLSWQHAHAYQNSDEFWKAVLRGNEECWVAWNQIGLRQMELGNAEVATTCYQRALKIWPEYAVAHVNLGNSLLQRGELAKARASLERALEITPMLLGAHHSLGNCFLKMGQTDQALTHFLRELEHHPALSDTNNNVGCLYLQQGDAERAMPYLERVIKLRPAHADGYANLGIALMAQGKASEGIRSYEQALEHNANQSAALSNLAWVLATSPDDSLRDGPRALELAERANTLLDGKDANALRTLAAAHAEIGDFTNAASLAERGASIAFDAGFVPLAETLMREKAQYSNKAPLRQ